MCGKETETVAWVHVVASNYQAVCPACEMQSFFESFCCGCPFDPETDCRGGCKESA